VSWLEELTILQRDWYTAGRRRTQFFHGVHESEDQREQSSRLVIVSHATEVARLSKEAA